MNFSSNRAFPAGNPLANALVIIVGALTIAASLVLGFFALLVLAALVAVFAAIVGIRVWWFNRRLRKAGAARPRNGEASPRVIEGEFHVVEYRKTPGEGD